MPELPDPRTEEALRSLMRDVRYRNSFHPENPTPEKVGTLWNSISQEEVTTQGARIGRIYRERPWERKADPSDSLPLLP
jgi:hypothetical protein